MQSFRQVEVSNFEAVSKKMLSFILSPVLFFVGAWVFYSWYCLFLNYLSAQKIGIPIRVIPISHENPLWMLVDKKVFIPLFSRLPFGSGSFTRYNWRGWEFADKCRSHLEMGDVFMLVTPGRNWLYVCNAESLVDVFQRRVGFPRPLELFEMVNIFGPNLSTTDGQQWQRHRKITATCFNEQNNETVWSESARQATDMIQYWKSKSSIHSVADDTRTFSLHVLSSAGFGKSFKFQGIDETSRTEVATNYKESLQTVLDNCILLMVLGTKFLSIEWLPTKLKRLHQATVAFKQYMTDVYEKEKQAISEGQSTGRNLMTSLIRSSQESLASGEKEIGEGLTESEIYGNIFVFNFAGHDTTAHTLAFAIVLLATEPEVQNWLSKEIVYVLGNRTIENWTYTEDFPRLKRCLAVLLETLRLYTPVPIAKSTGKSTQSLRVGDKTIMVPQNTLLIPNHIAVHTHPRYWGEEPLKWNPSRWIEGGKSNNCLFEEEVVITPAKGSFIAWSEGVRVCPGKKFSQVEFVAAMAGLFRDWRVDPVLHAGETMTDARERVRKLVEDDTGQVLLLQMLHPERAPLAWKKR